MRRRVALGVAAGALVAGLVATTVLTRTEDGARLPPVGVDVDPPAAYRIVYEVDTSGERTIEELVVRRPFEAHLTVTDGAGEVVSERGSGPGVLVTRSRGAAAVAIAVPLAPATGDQRLDLFAAPLVEAGRLTEPGTVRDLNGRRCRVLIERDGSPDLLIERCVDAAGLVLEERWIDPSSTTVLHRRAVEISFDVTGGVTPEAPFLPPEDGGGAVRRHDTAGIPFAEVFTIDAPDGFAAAGRYLVAPPASALANGAGAGFGTAMGIGPEVALITDIWTRGPDLLLLDQGATKGGPPPFDRDLVVGTDEVPGLGPVELALGPRLAEVRSTRADGGFVRVAGTLPLPDLLAVAGTLTRAEDAP